MCDFQRWLYGGWIYDIQVQLFRYLYACHPLLSVLGDTYVDLHRTRQVVHFSLCSLLLEGLYFFSLPVLTEAVLEAGFRTLEKDVCVFQKPIKPGCQPD